MSNTAGTPIPAGWYRDPAGSDQLRWWDGVSWTAHLAPQPAAAPAAQAPIVHAPLAQGPVVPTAVIQAPVAQADAFTPAPIFENSIESAPVGQLDEHPYVPFQNSRTAGGMAYAPMLAADFARPAQWNTAGVWFLATSLLWAGLVGGLATVIAGAGGSLDHLQGSSNLQGLAQSSASTLAVSLGASVIVWLLLIVAAARDQAKLRTLGFLNPTSVLWILLLPPLVYLIIRTVRVRRESGHGLAPMIFYAASILVSFVFVILAAIAIPVFLAEHGGVTSSATTTANATSLASGIKTGLENGTGTYRVTCTPFAKPTAAPIIVNCSAVDQKSNVSHALTIQLSPSASGGAPTVKLLGVAPPIASN